VAALFIYRRAPDVDSSTSRPVLRPNTVNLVMQPKRER
jgi:hypothetical protein